MQLKLSNKLSDLLCEVKAQSDQSFNKLIEEAVLLLASKHNVIPETKPLVEEANEQHSIKPNT